jgi:hypothetical protein
MWKQKLVGAGNISHRPVLKATVAPDWKHLPFIAAGLDYKSIYYC